MVRNSLIGALLLCGFGCAPEASVNLTRGDTGYTVVFKNCSHPKQVLPLKSLRIRVAGSDKEDPPWCDFGIADVHQIESDVTWSWRYGEAVPGYAMEGCAPLEPHTTYELHAMVANKTVSAVVRMDASGSPQRIRGGCQ